MKNKGSVILATIIIIPLFIIICFLAVRGSQKNEGTVSFFVFGSAELRNEIEIPLSEVDELEILYGSKNLHVYPTDGEQIIIKEYLISDKESAKAQVNKENAADGRKVVTVTGGNTFSIFFMGVGEKIEIYLPKEGLDALSLQTGSGNIVKEDDLALVTERFSVKAGSGNVTWKGALAKEIQIKTSSGNITGEALTGNVNLEAGSGSITTKELSGTGSAKAGSGNVKVEVSQLTGDFAVQTGSGNSKIKLPEDTSCYVEVQTGSGNIHTSFDLSYNKKGNQASGTVGSAPVGTISAEAGSGNVTIETH